MRESTSFKNDEIFCIEFEKKSVMMQKQTYRMNKISITKLHFCEKPLSELGNVKKNIKRLTLNIYKDCCLMGGN